jgi:hypothetical protein
MAEKENKLITDEMKKDAITMESSSSDYGFFDNKYVRAGIATALAVYAAKKEPYMLKSFAEKMEEFGKEDRDARRKYIESSAEGIGKVLAENAARRKERITDLSEKINNLTVYTKDKYKSASMIKAGLYTKMIAEATSGKDINSLFTVTEEFKGDKGSLSTAQLAGILSGTPTDTFPSKQFIAPKRISPVSKFISGSGDEDVTSDVRAQTQALVPDAFKEGDTDSIDAEVNLGGTLTERGKQFFSTKVSGDLTERTTNNIIVENIIEAIGGIQKQVSTASGPEYQYDSEIAEKKRIAKLAKNDIFTEVLELQKKEKGMTRTRALQIVLNKYKFGKGTTTYPELQKFVQKKTDVKDDKDSKDDKKKSSTSLTSDLAKKLKDAMKLDEYYTTGQGGKKFNKSKFLIFQSNEISKLVAQLASDSTSKYFNKPDAARTYIKGEIDKAMKKKE